ncbi:hypothetical protein TSL6_10520 [Sulfurovum sp. TSL6]|uniref:Rha family transcriptional regulator n=1 Tax=Sulfurovum sp. TSL6 TaxID=2826995 RepID=UPI001CC6FC56|nr:Rha family transcriptional regulator [Sulfurovum sp. TSL6]GIU00546.1 hypothetical protein TSL6_10520 [Sulfurovum sp. TSL6]
MMLVKVDNPTIEHITKAMLFHSGEPFASSIQISKYFEINHKDLLRKIRDFHSFEAMIGGGKLRNQTRVVKGREYPYFELDADAFTFICMSITGKQAEEFKWGFIQAYKVAATEAISARVASQTNRLNQEWLEARDQGKDTRKLLQDKIKEFCQYAELQRGRPYKVCPYYKLVTDAIYSYIGVVAPKCGKTLRDIYSGDIVEAIESSELEVIELLDEVMATNGSRKGIKPLILERLANE